MKAAICEKYGPPEVLKVKDVLKPIPKDDEVLIRVKASAVTASDCIIRKFEIPVKNRFPMGYFMEFMMGITLGFKKPKRSILGLILSGVVESTGSKCTRLKKGDEVFAFTGFNFGGYAEYACLKEKDSKQGCISVKPSNIDHTEAAAILYGGVIALHFLSQKNINKGDKILIYGASGAIGTSAVQIAKYFGAELTAVCSAANHDLVRSLGADKLIDYTKDETNMLERYDLVMDAVGKAKSSILKTHCKEALNKNGKYISVDDPGLKLKSEYLIFLKEMVEAGHFKAVIDRIYPLEDISEAHGYVDLGHKKGNVVIEI